MAMTARMSSRLVSIGAGARSTDTVPRPIRALISFSSYPASVNASHGAAPQPTDLNEVSAAPP